MLFLSVPAVTHAQPAEPEGWPVVGSVLLSIVRIPLKLATCVGTNIVVGVAYVATYGVEGNYDGGTHGRELGEMGAAPCKPPWVIRAAEVQRDWQ